jgi:hypothetical protein
MKKIILSWFLFFTITTVTFSQTLPKLHWVDLETFSNESFEKLAIDSLTLESFNVQHSRLNWQDLDGLPKNEILLAHCSLKSYREILKEPSARHMLQTLQLQPVNARLFTIPFYIVGSDQNLFERTAKSETLNIAFVTFGDSQIQEADLLTMLSEIFGKPKSAIKLNQERGPYPIAKKLYDGTYALAGIYEEEPSLLLDELQINLTEELKTSPAKPFPFPSKLLDEQLQVVSPDRMEYLFFVYQGTPFSELENFSSRTPIAAIALPGKQDVPVLLSNVQTRFSENYSLVSRALSNTYFLMLPSLSDSIDKETAEKIYLLNSYLNDSQNRYKSLGFLSSLLLSKEQKEGREKAELFQKKIELRELKAEEILKWLNIQTPQLQKRELFTSDVSSLYQSALSNIDEGLKLAGKKRLEKLEDARRELIAALLKGDQPQKIQGGRGMWSVRNYNPYYQLARVTFLLRMGERQ